MTKRILLSLLALLAPGAAFACGGNNPDFLGFLMIAVLVFLILPAFLIPFAGIVSATGRVPKGTIVIFLIYAGVAATIPFLLLEPSTEDRIAISGFVACVACVVAPSLHYLVTAIRRRRRSF